MGLRQVARRFIPRQLRAILRQSWHRIGSFAERQMLAKEFESLSGYRKIIYTISPHPTLSNIGDHAQAIAIRDWLMAEFPSLPVIELDKQQVLHYLTALSHYVSPDDLVFLHSGGNMGDRGIFSEMARRKVIQTFPNNCIVSLPQTIFFSDTPRGRAELSMSKQIYERHSRLTIVARDHVSAELAREYFPTCRHYTCPDFVLYLDSKVRPLVANVRRRASVVLCLRNDSERIIGESEREYLRRVLQLAVGLETIETDTSFPHPIPRSLRWKTFIEQLQLFAASRIVVTDRLHGVIFAILTRTPCIALPTADHKLKASYKWFEDITGVGFATDLKDVGSLAREFVDTRMLNVPDWAQMYFNGLGKRLCG